MSDWWEPAFQTTIDAYYQGNLAAGLSACERLLSIDGVPFEVELQTRRNLVFYAQTLQELGLLGESRRIEFPVAAGWSLFNPSIAATPDDDGFRAIVRSANYAVEPGLQYRVRDTDGVIRTANYLLDLSEELEIVEIQLIDDRALRMEPPLFPVAGFEDCRLFHQRGSWRASATTRELNSQGICQMAAFRLEGARATGLSLLSDAERGRHEKNWMPVVSGNGRADNISFVYSCCPTDIRRFEQQSGTLTREIVQPGPLVGRRFSGGSQAIAVDGGYLALIHEAIDFEDHGRVYTHRWVWFDPDWRLARLSHPFLLQGRGIEFAAGLARRGNDLIISFGLWDREAWLATVSLAKVLAGLVPPLDANEVEAELRGKRQLTVATDLSSITPCIARSPTIVSTTLAGDNQDIIGDALRSVADWVDWCLVIDTGIGDQTLELARAVAGDKLMVRSFPWQEDFAAARNFALQAAHELGADWAMTLDTDERIDFGTTDVRAVLAASNAGSLHVTQANGTYGKERFFRLPVMGQYVGPTHEAFIRDDTASETLEGVVFIELSKSPEQYRSKAERDIAILTRHTAEHPEDPRWFYYLGDSYAGLDRHEEAVAAFRSCANLNGWDEEGAWAMYRAAECLLRLGRPEEAIEACALGMAKHAGLAELSWMASYVAWQAGRPAQAAYWARHAIAMGHFAGVGGSVPRIGFRHPPALWEGPYDVLRFALRQLGDEQGAAEAERLYLEAMAARTNETG